MDKEDLFERAKRGDLKIIHDPIVSVIQDEEGRTPLHYLADSGCREVLKHPDVMYVRNKHNNTPLHYLLRRKRLRIADIRKLFPWYVRKRWKRGVTFVELNEILNTSQSIQYILGE